jgi:hypothetical protein
MSSRSTPSNTGPQRHCLPPRARFEDVEAPPTSRSPGNVGYTHVEANISASGDPAHIAMPCVHRVASLLKRWLLGTHQGGVSIRQLDFYLDEFVFRFNRRRSGSRGLLFYRLMEQAVATTPKPAKVIIGGRP